MNIDDVPNFNCVAKYKRTHTRSGGVAIYHNADDKDNIITLNILQGMIAASAAVSNIGVTCVSSCTTLNGQDIITAAIYVSPNQCVNNITDFLH